MHTWLRQLLTGCVCAGAVIASNGCGNANTAAAPPVASQPAAQQSSAGTPLPGPFDGYAVDDIQYFPPGPEFKLSRKAAKLQAARKEAAMKRAGAESTGY